MASSVAVQEQSGSTESNATIPTGNQMLLDAGPNFVKDAHLNAHTENAFAPKVRKPYTITKQRERWTEQEHDKFIEALKLYGRAWRKIEEHVGTKTAVQIRSHAQKFFSKVVRESTTTDVSSVKPIEIPPPRPKRKPMHPYPRKMSDPIKIGSSVADHSPMTKSPHYSEQDNCSPTSVFSAICSEMMDATDSDAPNGSESPVSSDGGVNPSSFSCSGAASPEDTGSLSPLQLTTSSTADEQVHVKLELFTPDNDFHEEEPAEAAVHSLKLFGKTVIVTDSCKPSSPTTTTGTYKSSSDTHDQKHEPVLPLSLMPTGYSSLNNPVDSWNPSMQGPPSAFYCMQLPSETSNVADSVSGPPMWAFYGGIQYPLFQMPGPAVFPFHNRVPTETNLSSVSGQTSDRGLQKEGSLTGSNNVSVYGGEDGDKNCDGDTRSCTGDARTSETTNLLKKRDNPVKIQKGFVPYKRCLAERDSLSSSTITGDEREEQRVRLCL